MMASCPHRRTSKRTDRSLNEGGSINYYFQFEPSCYSCSAPYCYLGDSLSRIATDKSYLHVGLHRLSYLSYFSKFKMSRSVFKGRKDPKYDWGWISPFFVVKIQATNRVTKFYLVCEIQPISQEPWTSFTSSKPTNGCARCREQLTFPKRFTCTPFTLRSIGRDRRKS